MLLWQLEFVEHNFLLEKWNYTFFLIASQYVIKFLKSDHFFKLVPILIENGP